MQSENANRKLSLRHLADGRHGVFAEDGSQIGTIDHKHLVQHMAAHQESLSRLSSALPGTCYVDREVNRRARELMVETGLDAGGAVKAVLRQDRALADRYRAAHTKEIGG